MGKENEILSALDELTNRVLNLTAELKRLSAAIAELTTGGTENV